MAQFSDPLKFQISYELLRSIEEEWNCSLESEISTSEASSLFLVNMKDSDELGVLKVARDFPALAREARCLESFGDFAVKIIDLSLPHRAMLMEQLIPGRSLGDIVAEGADDEATRILRDLIFEMQAIVPPEPLEDAGFPVFRDLLEDLEILQGQIPQRLLRSGEELFEKICAEEEDVLLHGDLHHGNVIESDRGWKIIDAKGFVGPGVFEFGALIRNPVSHFQNRNEVSKILSRRLDILAENPIYGRKRLAEGALCVTLLSMAWSLEDVGRIPPLTKQVAESLTAFI